MSFRKISGFALIALPFAAMTGLAALDMGLLHALLAWAVALGVAGCFIAGVLLIEKGSR